MFIEYIKKRKEFFKAIFLFKKKIKIKLIILRYFLIFLDIFLLSFNIRITKNEIDN